MGVLPALAVPYEHLPLAEDNYAFDPVFRERFFFREIMDYHENKRGKELGVGMLCMYFRRWMSEIDRPKEEGIKLLVKLYRIESPKINIIH